MPVTDRYVIRGMNEKLVLQTIIRLDTISRAEISKETLLNKATVSSIAADLLERKLILELGEGRSSGGRKPILVRFNHEAGIAVSIDLRPDRICLLFTYLNGNVMLEETLPRMEMNNASIIHTILEFFKNNTDKLPPTPYGIIGISLAIHGIVNEGAIAFSPFYELDTKELQEELAQQLELPVFLENEANLGALGEKYFSTPSSNLISINVKYGIGAGIILNNELFTGANGFAGEVGHMIAVPNGLPCPCGNHGCLEQYTSEYKLLHRYVEENMSERFKLKILMEDYEKAVPRAVEMIEEFTDYLAIGLNNLMTAFNPSVIVINSRLVDQPNILRLTKSKLTYRLNGRTMIKSSFLHEKAILLGGVHIVCERFLGI